MIIYNYTNYVLFYFNKVMHYHSCDVLGRMDILYSNAKIQYYETYSVCKIMLRRIN